MYAFKLGTYRLPFVTIAFSAHVRNHQHTDPEWVERMELAFHVPAIYTSALHPPANQNEARA